MNLSDSLKALVLAGSLAGRCPSPEPPPGPTPSDAGVADVLPATPDTAAADTGPMPGDAGASADATAPDGGGTPQPDAEPMPQGPVTSTFEGGVSYLLYPYGGGPECAANQDPVFTVSLRAGESACVPAGYTDMLPFAMTEVQVCTAGAGCAPCDEGDVRCAPQTCFAPLPAPAPGDACTNRLQHRDGEEVTRYVLFRAVDIENPPASEDGLPMVLNVSITSEVTLNPPADRPRFVRAALTPPDVDGGGESCGGSSLCGLFPFQAVNTGWSWFAFEPNPFLFSYWPLF